MLRSCCCAVFETKAVVGFLKSAVVHCVFLGSPCGYGCLQLFCLLVWTFVQKARKVFLHSDFSDLSVT